MSTGLAAFTQGQTSMDATLTSAYARWRSSSLGQITERIEQDLIFELVGPLSNRRVLDVGAGDGVYGAVAAKQGANVIGVDKSADRLAEARRRALASGVEVELVEGDASALPFSDDEFDVVLAITLLCLVGDADLAVREMARVLKPGGIVVVGELGRFSSWAALRRVRGWLGNRTWRRARFRSARELASLLRSAGLVVERTQGAIYYPPLGIAARVLGGLDALPRRYTTAGAAFIGVAARKPGKNRPTSSGGKG